MSSQPYKAIFAIGDVHGCNIELRLLLNKLPLSKDTLVVFLGDYIDRGADSKGVVDTILELRKHVPVVTLRGNHEDMFLDFMSYPDSVGAGMFIFNGGLMTLASYQTQPGHFEISDEHRAFYRSLQYFFETDEYFFVHAGVPNIPLSEIDAELHGEQLMWIRSSFLNSSFPWKKTVVHGHTPVASAEIHDRRINVDTGCVYDNHLTAIDLETLKVFTVEKQTKREEPSFLRNPASPNRVAVRFSGSLKVYVNRGLEQGEFETLNYTQFGMLIRYNAESDSPHFVMHPGERITGMIEAKAGSHLEFEGQVVRTETRDDNTLYGIKLDYIGEPGDDLK